MAWWVLALRLSGLGFYIATCILGGIGLGALLDHILDTGFIFLLIGLTIGSALAFYGTYRMVVPLFGDIDYSDGSKKGRKS
jgi:F0F1-type ATP synthase assembly protein I